MTPDPSGAARAPQTTLDEVREALAEYKRALLYWDDLPGKCTEDEAHAISTHIKKHAPRWLGALVQAVEDQQRKLENRQRAVELVGADRDRARASAEHWEHLTAQANGKLGSLEAEVAQLRADGQRLRDALDTIYKIAAGGDVRRTAFEALHPDEAPPEDAP